MNCIEFYEAIARQDYCDNPERAEELYKYSKNRLIEEALEGKKISELSVDKMGEQLFRYWYLMGLSFEQCGNMLTYSNAKWRNKYLRPEFDEEYVEYGFLSIEDGGRGVEY